MNFTKISGNTYNLDIFYAERGPGGATFRFITNLQVNPNPPPDLVGCSDEVRDGFTDWNAFPCIAACSSSWSYPGLMNPVSVRIRAVFVLINIDLRQKSRQ